MMKTMMKLMKMSELLLILSCVLCVSFCAKDHEDLAITGCSDSDGEKMFGLDGEEVWYADFNKGKGVVALPPFAKPINFPGGYENALNGQQVCKSNLKNCRIGMKDIPLEYDPPSGHTLYSRDEVELGVQNTLICHVTGFYPAPVKVDWTKNGKTVTEGTSINVPYPNKDGSFSQSSRLEFIPQQGDMYSCSVSHPTLSKPLTRFWGEKVFTSVSRCGGVNVSVSRCGGVNVSVSRCGGVNVSVSRCGGVNVSVCFLSPDVELLMFLCVFCLQMWRC
ncbi:RLA class II histocompatibility antigen, DP alpha-1 chain-like [Scomber japonicus]|uniref:RLA class II histocompatibility antigen, DP alpha-1 chain-like n=1 Tax=Scomber japonicus TaxID=13676 RepID=UPI0023069AD0|nr:RLA class II histocompatibility antigen, DP alpha-1 chain-like [Scomber japonicus]